MRWKAGTGRLGPLDPLLGAWVAEGSSPAGPYRCERRFERTLGGRYVQLRVDWQLPAATHEELALFGIDAQNELRMWAFASDGRHSAGRHIEAWGLPRPNLTFEAETPGGASRLAYWPDKQAGGVRFVVESRTGRTWTRFLEHLYRPLT